MIRMLHIAGSMSPSGIGNYIMNVYRHVDRSLVQFDFLLCEKREVSFDEEIESLGGRIFYITRKSVSPLKNFAETMEIIKKEKYNVVFRHTDISTVALDLVAAALGGAKERIPHSHSTSTGNKKMHRLFMPLLNMISTRRFACSPDAGRWLYGSRKSFEVVQNAIDLKDFAYDEAKREAIKKNLDIEDKLVIGHVGNLLPVKNHLFMLDILKEFLQFEPRAILLLVGDGVMADDIRKKAKALRIEEKVIMAGVRNDIPDLLSAMDIFLFPSYYEGMPIALVEAQASGLPCVISDTITTGVDVLPENIIRMSLRYGTDGSNNDREYLSVPGPGTWDKGNERSAAIAWALRLREASIIKGRTVGREPFANMGFDIDEMVKKYEKL